MEFVSFGIKTSNAIVFLHGWGGSNVSFMGAMKAFAALGFYAIGVDFPGHGKTPVPKSAYSVEDYANEVVKLLNSEKIKDVIIVGHSFGGRVAIKLAAKGSDLGVNIRKVVLVSSAGIKPRKSIVKSFKIYRYKKLKKKVKAGKLDEKVLLKYGSQDYKKLVPIMKASFIKIVEEDLTQDAAAIRVPTLLVWGKRDRDTPLYMARRLNKVIENSRLVIYNAGHYSYIDEREKFLEDVYLFIMTN